MGLQTGSFEIRKLKLVGRDSVEPKRGTRDGSTESRPTKSVKASHGVFPRTGSGVPAAEGDADGEGLAWGFAGAGGADAAGLEFGPGWVFGGAGGGFAAAAG